MRCHQRRILRFNGRTASPSPTLRVESKYRQKQTWKRVLFAKPVPACCYRCEMASGVPISVLPSAIAFGNRAVPRRKRNRYTRAQSLRLRTRLPIRYTGRGQVVIVHRRDCTSGFGLPQRSRVRLMRSGENPTYLRFRQPQNAMSGGFQTGFGPAVAPCCRTDRKSKTPGSWSISVELQIRWACTPLILRDCIDWQGGLQLGSRTSGFR
jgi:hypothetical protein